MLKIGRRLELRGSLLLLRLVMRRTRILCRCLDGIIPWICRKLLRCIFACIKRIYSSAIINSSSLMRTVHYYCWKGQKNPYSSRCYARNIRIIGRSRWRSSSNPASTSSFLSSTHSRRSRNLQVKRIKSSTSSGSWTFWCEDNWSLHN